MLILLGLVVLSVPAAAEQLVALMVQDPMSNPSTLVRLPISSTPQGGYALGTPVAVGPLGGQVVGTALAPSGQLLALDPGTDRLLWVDPSTGATVDSVPLDLDLPIDLPSDIAVSPSGEAWLVTETNPTLYRLSITSGATVPIGDMGLDFLQTITWHNGQLYGAGGGALFLVDTVTAELALVTDYGVWGTLDSVDGLGSYDSTMWGLVWCFQTFPGPCVSSVVTIDAVSGYAEVVGELDGRYRSFEVLDLGAGAEIPALGAVGIALLVLLLAGAGVILLRQA